MLLSSYSNSNQGEVFFMTGQDFQDRLDAIVADLEARPEANIGCSIRGLSETFRTRRAAHQNLIDAATAARIALQDALAADNDYQAADTALKAAQTDPDYVAARTAYQNNNVSENFGNLSEARGKYHEV